MIVSLGLGLEAHDHNWFGAGLTVESSLKESVRFLFPFPQKLSLKRNKRLLWVTKEMETLSLKERNVLVYFLADI